MPIRAKEIVMSRYSLNQIVRDIPCEVAYGYDRPMAEYFCQVWPKWATRDYYAVFSDMPPQCLDTEELLETGAPATEVSGSKGRVLEFVEALGITLPEAHLTALALDLPF
jgi:hypothetical protein